MPGEETQPATSAMPPALRVNNERFAFEIVKLTDDWREGYISTDDFVAQTLRWADCLAQTLHEDKKAARRAQSK